MCADDAGDVRPVSVAVVWNRIGRDDGAEVVAIEGVADEVVSLFDTTPAPEATAQIRMIEVDAGVHDGDANAAAGQSEIALGDIDARHLDRGGEIRDGPGRLLLLQRVDPHHGKDAPHAGHGAHSRDFTIRRADTETVPQRAEMSPLGVANAGGSGARVKIGLLALKRGDRRAFDPRIAGELDEPEVRERFRAAEGNGVWRLRVDERTHDEQYRADGRRKIPHRMPRDGCEGRVRCRKRIRAAFVLSSKLRAYYTVIAGTGTK